MALSKKAVQFGAGNIGRGFVAQSLHASGYEVVFADIDEALVEALRSQSSYEVHEVGEEPRVSRVEGYRAFHSKVDEEALVAEISTADIVTTAVGARILPFVAPLISKALAKRSDDLPPLVVVACENAINASDSLASFVRGESVVFANCAIDRIVPEQSPGLDVTMETFSEWIIESRPFEGRVEVPAIHGVIWVPDLEPFIDRKLFTVNTAHATAAYHGFVRGIASVREALENPEVRAEVRSVLAETKSLLVAKHHLDPCEHDVYIEKSLLRIANPYLLDTTERVGRNPLRKISRHERLVGPSAQLAEEGLPVTALVRSIRAALDFFVVDDVESVEMRALLRSGADASQLAETLFGVYPEHPLFADLAGAVRDRLSTVRVEA